VLPPDLEFLDKHGLALRVASNLEDQFTLLIDQGIEDIDDPDVVLPGGISTFVKKVGQSNSHFLEGFLSELPNGGGSEAGRAIPSYSKVSRKSPLASYDSRKTLMSPRKDASPRSRSSPRSSSTKPIEEGDGRRPMFRRQISACNELDQSEIIKRSDAKQREACESLRILVFGIVGNEHWKEAEKQLIFEQSRGTMEEVGKFVKVWSQLDDDGSGDLDYNEFSEFFTRNKSDRLLCMRCVKYLLGSGKQNDANKLALPLVSREDLMRLIWLKASSEDIVVMHEMFDLHAFKEACAPDPPLLPKRKRRQLLENFVYLDSNHEGKIAYLDLVNGGLVDMDLMLTLIEMYDHGGHGTISQDVFLEMLCPYGFVAHERITRMLSAEDTIVCKVHVICPTYVHQEVSGWISEADLERFKEQTSLHFRFAPTAESCRLGSKQRQRKSSAVNNSCPL
jgi:Ca2+-binding EF-hand superfamily protein